MEEGTAEDGLGSLLAYETARARHHATAAARLRHAHLARLQRLCALEEKQNTDLIELRNRIEFINRHATVIQSALRDAGDDDAAVPVCSNIVKDIIAVKNNIQESINNSLEIKEMLGVNYEPLMENLLKKMEVQLNNWTSVLNVASRNLLNSRALMENIQNLIVTQQQICSEVAESDIFSNFNDAINSTPLQEVVGNDSTGVDLLEESPYFCSTPLNN